MSDSGNRSPEVAGQQPLPSLAHYEETQVQIEQWQFQTPLLPPAVLRQYQELIPDFSDRYMKGWESQTAHRQALERTVVETQAKTQLNGQKFALALGVLVVIGAVIVALAGEGPVAIAMIGIDFISLGGAFVYARHRNSRDLEAKAQQVPAQPTARPTPAPANRQLPKGQPTQQRPRNRNKKKRR